MVLKSRRTTVFLGACALIAGWAGSGSASPRIYEFGKADGKWTVVVSPAGSSAELDPIAEPTVDAVRITPGATAVAPVAEGPVTAPAPRELPETTEAPEAAPGEAPATEAAVPCFPAGDVAAQYAEIYNSIPFIRSVYEVNPTYRHDTTVELLFGRMRPTVIHRHEGLPAGDAFVPPAFGAVAPYTYGVPPYLYAFGPGPYQYYDLSRGPYSLYRRLFGYDGGWRSQFYLNAGYGNPYAIWW